MNLLLIFGIFAIVSEMFIIQVKPCNCRCYSNTVAIPLVNIVAAAIALHKNLLNFIKFTPVLSLNLYFLVYQIRTTIIFKIIPFYDNILFLLKQEILFFEARIFLSSIIYNVLRCQILT